MRRATTAPMPCAVVAVHVRVGDEVRVGDDLCTTETMKCETTHVAETAGRVAWAADVGATLDAGDALVRLTTGAPAPWAPADVVGLLRTASDLLPECAGGEYTPLHLVDDELHCTEAHDGSSGVTVGLVRHVIEGHPDGVERVLICGDPTRSMGAVAEPECRAIIAAIELAARRRLAVEWVAVSAGARIAWDSGTENMDWCAAVARHLVRFTQGDLAHNGTGGPPAVNIIVAGINVGAQSYWNALAAMLGHTTGIIVMVRGHAMVLTGRTALAAAGGGRYHDDASIGGYDEVMGPNGQSHHVVDDLPQAYRLLFDHLSVAQPRRDGTPPRVPPDDLPGRDIAADPYVPAGDGATLAEVLESRRNPTRRQPFAIRPVMAALADRSSVRLEPWADLAGGETAIVWLTRMGGWPVTMVGVESRPTGGVGGDGPARPASTLTPDSSRKVARAISAARGRRPVVVVANLAGFDGSAPSMRRRQLEYGAEIARAVVNFEGPIVVAIVGRFHGGAYVVFSRRLNPGVRVVALEGSFVSVIGGAAAARVVFAGDVRRGVDAEIAAANGEIDRGPLEARRHGEVADRFDEIHDVHRAAAVGSVDEVVRPDQLRAAIISRLDDWTWPRYRET